MIKLIRFFNTLSFDTAFGAVSFALIISYSQRVDINPFIYLALIISVLSIYNLDHLLDARKLKGMAKSFRHSFYQKHFKMLVFWQVILIVIGLPVLYFLPVQVLLAGFIMCLSLGIYFLIIFKTRYKNYVYREVLVAIGYTIAVAVIPFANTSIHLEQSYYGILVIVFLLALSNLWVFAIYDAEIDKSQEHHSITRAVNNANLLNTVRAVILLNLLLILSYFIYYRLWILGISLFLVGFTYLVLLENQRCFCKNEHYRLLGELVLVLPGIIIFVQYAI